MKNYLLEALRANDKTGYLFETNSTFVAYKTGFPVLDYSMGFLVNVFKITSSSLPLNNFNKF